MIAPAREVALRVLDQVERGATLADALARERDKLPDTRDRALVTEIATGALRWLARLDAAIAARSARPVDSLDPTVRRILRLAVYQLLFLDRIPPRAVVDDAVELTRASGLAKATGFVNALLRGMIRDRARTGTPTRTAMSPATADLETLAVEVSHPQWLLGRWIARYGVDAAVRWARFNNQPAPLTLRTNTRHGSRQMLIDDLAGEGIETEPTLLASQGLRLRSGEVLSSRALREGRFIVQDEASQLVGELAATLAGPRMLDACAAPGGKTLALAAALPADGGTVVAADRRPRRLRLLQQNLRRTGLAPHAPVVQIDLRSALPFPPVFDLVLVDAPCSGLGTVRREPDIKWRRTEGELAALAEAQGRMLDVAARAVRPGGRLVYATCSSEPEENEAVVAAFLDRQPAFAAASSPDGGWPGALWRVMNEAGHLRTLPHLHELEAFFAAPLQRAG